MPSSPGERYDFFLSRRGSVAALRVQRHLLPFRIKPVHWNGTHLSVFEFRVEKERGHDFDAAGASV